MFKRTSTRIASLFLFASFYGMADVKDLGTYANTYEIKEKSFKVSIAEGIAELNVTQLKKDVLESFELLAEGRSTIPVSQEEERYTAKNLYTVPHDIMGIDGSIAYHMGEKIVSEMPKGMELNLCFIDARNTKVVPLIAEKFGKCIYFSANRPIDEVYPLIAKQSADGRIYPMNERYTKRFGITKLPTKVRLYSDKIDYTILNQKELIKEASRREP